MITSSSLQSLGEAAILLDYSYSAGCLATYDDPSEPEELYIESASLRMWVKGEPVQCKVEMESFAQEQIDAWETAILEEIEEGRRDAR